MESLAQDLSTMVRTPLHDSHVAALREIGVERDWQAGAMLQEYG